MRFILGKSKYLQSKFKSRVQIWLHSVLIWVCNLNYTDREFYIKIIDLNYAMWIWSCFVLCVFWEVIMWCHDVLVIVNWFSCKWICNEPSEHIEDMLLWGHLKDEWDRIKDMLDPLFMMCCFMTFREIISKLIQFFIRVDTKLFIIRSILEQVQSHVKGFRLLLVREYHTHSHRL